MRMKATTVLSVLVALSLSCSGGGLTCESAACGGDPVGAWTVSDNCYDSTGVDPSPGCPGFDYCVQGNTAVFKQAATADAPALAIVLSK